MPTHDTPPRPADIAAPEFTPVPLARTRHDGWSIPRQTAFLRALCVTGSVSTAARMVGMSRKAAYALRGREGRRASPRRGIGRWAKGRRGPLTG